MALYTFGGNPADVLTTSTGDVVPDYPVLVRVAGTGQLVTALYEDDGVTPIGELRSNPADAPQPGAIRTFKTDVPAIEYEYNDAAGHPIRWFENGREVAGEALTVAEDALPRSTGGTVSAPVTLAAGASVTGGLDVTGGGTVDDLTVTGSLTVAGEPAGGGVDLTGAGIFNVRDYGAVGDGTADDAPAVQQALTACFNAGGGQVLVPPGTYRLATLPLRIYRHTRLTLARGAIFLRGGSNTLLLNGDSDQDFGGYSGHGDLIIEGGVWDMRATDRPTGPDMCISIGHADGVTIRDLEIRDLAGYHAIELNSTRRGVVERCAFRGYLDTGGRDFSEAVQVDLAGRVSLFGGFGPYDSTVCQDVVMRDCYVGASGTTGTVAWPAMIGSHSTQAGNPHKRISVIGNTAEGCAQWAIKPYCWDDTIIERNKIIGCGSGVWLRTLDSSKSADRKNSSGVDTNASAPNTTAVIRGNIMRALTGFDAAISVQGESSGRWSGVSILGNTIDTTAGTSHGVRMTYSDHSSVRGNTFRSIGGTAISTTAVTYTAITSNRAHSCGSSFVTMETDTDMHVADNFLTLCGSHGMWAFTNCARLRIANNMVKGAGGTDGTGQGFRFTSTIDRLTLTGNTYQKRDTGTQATTAIYLSSAVTNVRRFGNDVLGQAATPISDSSVSPVLSPYDAGTP